MGETGRVGEQADRVEGWGSFGDDYSRADDHAPQDHIGKAAPGRRSPLLFQYTLRGRKKDYWVQTFGTTTLKTTVTLVPLAQMEMSASDPEARKPDNPNEYVYDKVFIVGEDIHIRWKVTG